MEIHNSTEDIVLQTVNEIYDEIEREGKPDRPCTCYQCRLDTACYVLNRSAPRYVVSSRGAVRAETESIVRQQEEADVVSLIHEGLQKIAKSMRPHFEHNAAMREAPVAAEGPRFNIPTIIGRVFNGANFEPLTDIDVTLLYCGKKAEMVDPNWQNPFKLVSNTAGAFSFWPEGESADAPGISRKFEFTVVASGNGYEELRHFFEIEVVSEARAAESFSVQRTFKLPDLYLFPPGEDEEA
jgi:competence protein ComFB